MLIYSYSIGKVSFYISLLSQQALISVSCAKNQVEQHQHGSDVICVGAGFTGSVLGFQDGQLRRTNLNAKIVKKCKCYTIIILINIIILSIIPI